MTRIDRQTFFSALGFLAVLMKDVNANKDGANRVIWAAKLIEAFCEASSPELAAERNAQNKDEVLDKLIEHIKGDIEQRGEARLPDDHGTLHGLYARLIQRHRAYATDDLIADATLFFLEEENRHAKEADMMIVKVQGKDNLFAPCREMATEIAKIMKEKGSCEPSDLQGAFSAEDIKRRWAMAYALAKVELNWMDA